jgi:hypothetical protein
MIARGGSAVVGKRCARVSVAGTVHRLREAVAIVWIGLIAVGVAMVVRAAT